MPKRPPPQESSVPGTFVEPILQCVWLDRGAVSTDRRIDAPIRRCKLVPDP